MTLRRRTALLALPLLAACAGDRGRDTESAAERFAQTLEASESAVDGLIGRMDGFERRSAQEEEAIAFATGRGRTGALSRFTPPPAGAADAAGRVLDGAFAALGEYAEVLAEAATGQRVVDRDGSNGEALARSTANGLDALASAGGGSVAGPVRDAGLRGIAALADLPQAIARRGERASQGTVVAEAQPHVAAVAALLREAIGAEPGLGARGAIRARRNALDASQARLLAAVRADGRVGPTDRYNVFRGISDARDNDPPEGAFGALVNLVASMEQAHAALANEGPDAYGKVGAFEGAVSRLRVYNEASRRG